MPNSGIANLAQPFQIPNDYVTTVTIDVDDNTAFTEGSVCIISIPSELEPFVGLVQKRYVSGLQLDITVMSVGATQLGATISTPAVLTFGNAVSQWTAAPGNRQYQYNVYWPTDPSLVPVNVTWTFAKGDGVTDDSFAINNALKLASENPNGGGIVMLPAGTFLCNSPLFVDKPGVHLWGVGRGATIIKQGMDLVSQTNAAVIIVHGTENTLMHFTVQGKPNTTSRVVPTGVPPNPTVGPNAVDPGFGAGWAILCANSKSTLIEDVEISQTPYSIAAIVYTDVRIRNCVFDLVLYEYAGVYAQGQTTGNASGSLGIGGTPGQGDTITVTLTDDGGYGVTVEYTLTISDTSVAIVAQNVANAINASAAAAFVLATPTATGVTLTAVFGGVEGNSYTVSASSTGGVTVQPTSFQGGSGNFSNDVQILDCSCSGDGSDPNLVAEAYHCDGGVFTFIVRNSGALETGWHTRVINANSALPNGGPKASDPQQIELTGISCDHTQNGLAFVNGYGLVIRNSLVTSNLLGSTSPGIDIQQRFANAGGAAQATIEGNQIVSEGSLIGIRIGTGDVQVRSNTFAYFGTAVKLVPAGAISGIQIVGNEFSNSGGTGIDLGGVIAGSDWLTIVGNTFVIVPTPIAFPTGAGGRSNLGKHSRMTDNPGYNPAIPSAGLTPVATGTPVPNPYFSDAMVAITASGMGSVTVKLIDPNGNTQPYLPASSVVPQGTTAFVPVPCGYSVELTYTHAPSWSWIPT